MSRPSLSGCAEGLHDANSPWYVAAMRRLVGVVQQLSQARDLDAVTEIVRQAARELTGADGATFVLREGDQCYYAEENAIEPLWKGRRFHMSMCISGWVMLNRRFAAIEDIYQDPRIPVDAYRPTFVKSLLMTPIRSAAPIGAIGNYWATTHLATDEETAILQALADSTSVALENIRLYQDLEKHVAKLQRQELRIREQHESLEVFTRALAHDLREPVRTVKSFVDLIAEEDATPEEIQKYFRYIRSSAGRTSTLIDAVFRYTQLDDPQSFVKQRCSMDQALHDAESNLRDRIHDRDATVFTQALPTIAADSAMMVQLLQNLIANALCHCPQGVTVRVAAQELPECWEFSVSDDGPGVPADQRERIFLPFKRLMARDDCSGLGLAMCRKIVQQHGGTISCRSASGGGANFVFTLPRSAVDARADESEPVIATASTPDLHLGQAKLAHVLLVDDRKDDIELTRLMLFGRAKLQCKLSVARDGEEALKILDAARQRRETVDLMLLDINMPGMDGFEVLERVRRERGMKDVRVVMCTGSNYHKDKQRAELLGVDGYLEKPPELGKLKLILKEIDTLAVQFSDGAEQLLPIRPCDAAH